MADFVRKPVPDRARAAFDQVRAAAGAEVDVFDDYIDQQGDHPEDYRNFECSFAADHLARIRPAGVLDVGSNRLFVTGLAAHYNVTSIDIRPRNIRATNEQLLHGAQRIDSIPSGSIDVVLSLNAIEHFGLGRYGDAVDPLADQKAFAAWRRIVRPGGHIVFSTTITSAGPAIAFNAHRIYAHRQIVAMCGGLRPIAEAAFSNSRKAAVPLDQLNTPLRQWDLYCGCWQKA